jgi:hypothetical protein
VFQDMLYRHDVITVQSFSKAVIRWGCIYDKSLKSSDIETIMGRVVSEAVFKWCHNLRHPATNHFTFRKCDREPSERLKKHSLGELNPYTKDPFDPEVVQVYKLSNLNTNNMLHASHLNPLDVKGFLLPGGNLQFRVWHAKVMAMA